MPALADIYFEAPPRIPGTSTDLPSSWHVAVASIFLSAAVLTLALAARKRCQTRRRKLVSSVVISLTLTFAAVAVIYTILSHREDDRKRQEHRDLKQKQWQRVFDEQNYKRSAILAPQASQLPSDLPQEAQNGKKRNP